MIESDSRNSRDSRVSSRDSSSTTARIVYTVLASISASSSSWPTCTATRSTLPPFASGTFAAATPKPLATTPVADGVGRWRTSKAPPGRGLYVTSRRVRALPTATSASGSHGSARTPSIAAGACGDTTFASPGALLGALASRGIDNVYSRVSG